MAGLLCSCVDDLVFGVQGEGGVRGWDGAQSRCHEVRRVVDEVLVCVVWVRMQVTSREIQTRASSQDILWILVDSDAGFCSPLGGVFYVATISTGSAGVMSHRMSH